MTNRDFYEKACEWVLDNCPEYYKVSGFISGIASAFMCQRIKELKKMISSMFNLIDITDEYVDYMYEKHSENFIEKMYEEYLKVKEHPEWLIKGFTLKDWQMKTFIDMI